MLVKKEKRHPEELRVPSALVNPRLLRVQDSVLAGLGDAEFDDFLGWDLDCLASGWIATGASLTINQHELAETGQGEAVLGVFVREISDELENFHGGALGHVGLLRDGGCDLGLR